MRADASAIKPSVNLAARQCEDDFPPGTDAHMGNTVEVVRPVRVVDELGSGDAEEELGL